MSITKHDVVAAIFTRMTNGRPDLSAKDEQYFHDLARSYVAMLPNQDALVRAFYDAAGEE